MTLKMYRVIDYAEFPSVGNSSMNSIYDTKDFESEEEAKSFFDATVEFYTYCKNNEYDAQLFYTHYSNEIIGWTYSNPSEYTVWRLSLKYVKQ